MIPGTNTESPRSRHDGLYEFRHLLAKVVLARLEKEIGSVSAHFGESYELGDDPEAVAYRKTGGAFRFLAFAFAPWRMWDLHVGTVPVEGSLVSVGYHISVRAGPLLMDKLHAMARQHGIEVIHQPMAVEFQANLPPFDTSLVSAEILADTVCSLSRRFAKVASATSCPPLMRAGQVSPPTGS